MLEIELKARVSNHEAVKERLFSLMNYLGEIDKSDEYWSLPLVNSLYSPLDFRLRLRIEPGKATVISKEKTYTESLEVNKEVEFGILDTEAFRQFLSKMSATLLYRKQKKRHVLEGRGWHPRRIGRRGRLGRIPRSRKAMQRGRRDRCWEHKERSFKSG